MTVAKTLKYLKRVIQKINKINFDIASYNSIIKGGDREVDVKALYEKRGILLRHLCAVKNAITAHNVKNSLQEKIYQLAELKSQVKFLQSISTRHGPEANVYQETPIEYEAIFRKNEVDKMIEDTEKEIDALQEVLDISNHRVNIDIDPMV